MLNGNNELGYLLYNVSIDLADIKRWSYNNFVCINSEKVPLAGDYCFWLFNGLSEDYQTITFLLNGMNDVNFFSLRPLYCILRSSFEKYADILNFIFYKDTDKDYNLYISYLNTHAVNNPNYKIYEERFKSIFEMKYCNRRSRYYLLKLANEYFFLLEQADHNLQYYPISKFNEDIINYYDHYYSQLLHNNLDYKFEPNWKRIVDILKQLQSMIFATTSLLPNYYGEFLGSSTFNRKIDNIKQVKVAIDKL